MNVTATGLDPTIDHRVIPPEFRELDPPNGTDRLVLTAGWASGSTGEMRIEILERGCLTACRQEPLAAAEGPAPLLLELAGPPEATLHLHVTADGETRVEERVEGTARFLADPPPTRASTSPQTTGDASAPSGTDTGEPAWREKTAAAVGAIGALALFAWTLDRTRWLAPITGLFSRFSKDELLDHPVRRAIVDAVEATPGVHLEALVRRLDLGRGQLEHHLAKLVQADLLVAHEAAGYRAFFRPGQAPAPVREAIVLLKTPGARDVLRAAREQPGAGVRQLARETGLAASTVSYHVRRLIDAGLLDAARARGCKALRPTALAREALDRAPLAT